jgi:hypothetical protein
MTMRYFVMTCPPSFAQLSNEDLLAEVKRLAAGERQATARLIACLMEVDARRLYLGEGCSSLFTYCTQVLHLSEHAAYGRIEAARAARRFPQILARLAEGDVTLTTIGLLAPHLTPANHVDVLDAARHKSKREVEQLVARLRPLPDVPSSVRKLPAPKPVALPESDHQPFSDAPHPPSTESLEMAPSRTARPVMSPLAPDRYKVQFTVSRETFDKLRRAQDLLRHTIPNGDPSAIFDRALTLLVNELERSRLDRWKATRRRRPPAPTSRHIPADVKRAVWTRDGGRCAFEGTTGRCTETGLLQFHHVVPYARGGRAVVDNIELRCAAHNAYEAEVCFGPRAPAAVREHAPPFALA